MSDCPLCEAVNDERRLVYATMSIYPVTEGNVLVLPKRHTKMEGLSIFEMHELNDVCCDMKGRLLKLYPDMPPFLYSALDTHASVPEHFHYHLIPSEMDVRKLMVAYTSIETDKVDVDISKLEKIAMRLR